MRNKRWVFFSVVLLVLIIISVLGVNAYYSSKAVHSSQVSPQPTPAPTPVPTPTPIPTPTPAPSVTPNITISYLGQGLIYQNPDSDNFNIEIRITIKNNGYDDGFSTDPSNFTLYAGQPKFYPMPNFTYNATATSELGEWKNVIVSNGATYSGILVFSPTCDLWGAFAGPPNFTPLEGYCWWITYQTVTTAPTPIYTIFYSPIWYVHP